MSSPEPLQKLLVLEGCYNTRDIGGYETLDGKKTSWCTILRLDGMTAEQINQLHGMLID
ncbi:tyrosine-protein phosphatase [Brasilonema sp. UFV-L1]|uniref:tyrosine-protein phosphatase n=1 Tax=Brasilonema sp. UFV-L1 TaxID=2234130 RepID=UPI00145E5F27|nr:tyrosine-protein phosphatase [Brasilonema sp. UFV-L1]NMG07027.1 hypothetical protein [Brasilonema sp. UFV-L1]